MTDSDRPEIAILDLSLTLPGARPEGRAGRVAVAAHDEDVVTMGATATLELLGRHPGLRPQALLLASTSSPLADGGVVQEIAEIAGIAAAELHVAEHGGTVAAGVGVLTHAIGLIAMMGGPIVVVVADDRRDGKGRPLGAGALALLLDREGGIGRLRWLGSRAEVRRDQWRPWYEPGLRDGDRSLTATADDWARPTEPDAHPVLDCGPRTPRLDGAGLLGCAAPLTAAVHRARHATVGSSIRIIASAGGVSHAVDLVVGPAGAAAGKAVDDVLRAGLDQAAATAVATEEFAPYTSGPRAYRERGQDLRLEGQRDLTTNETLFPPLPIAAAAGTEPTRLGRRGVVLTMTTDRVYPHGGPIQMVVVDLIDGGRFFGQAVPECPPLQIDDAVVVVPRNLYTTAGLAQRYWKVAPASPTHGQGH